MVPVDDTHTARFSLRRVPSTNMEADQRITSYFEEVSDYNAADHHQDLFEKGIYPEDPLVRLTSAQDYVALMGQGSIAKRRSELLGSSDKGIAFLRRIFFRELTAVETEQPTKAWRRNAQPIELPLPQNVARGLRADLGSIDAAP